MTESQVLLRVILVGFSHLLVYIYSFRLNTVKSWSASTYAVAGVVEPDLVAYLIWILINFQVVLQTP